MNLDELLKGNLTENEKETILQVINEFDDLQSLYNDMLENDYTTFDGEWKLIFDKLHNYYSKA